MKSNKDFRVKEPVTDPDEFIRKPAKLGPVRKSGKEKTHYTTLPDDGDDFDEDLDFPGKRESVLDYFDEKDEE